MPDEVNPPNRIVTLVLVTSDGKLVGSLPPFEVDSPWWPEAGPIVEAARERHGLEVTVLRLLSGTPGSADGRATYLAEVDRPLTAEPWYGDLDDHPIRLPWARPGGPAAGTHRRGPAGGRLPGIPRQHRACRAALPPAGRNRVAESLRSHPAPLTPSVPRTAIRGAAR